jgi:flavin-dependent dehydrogenase
VSANPQGKHDDPDDLPLVVIGGGPAGSVCARQLARLGHRVVLAQQTSLLNPRPAEICDPSVQRLLESASDLSIPRIAHRPLPSFSSAWGSDRLDGRAFGFWQAEEALVIDRASFDEWLRRCAEAAGVSVLRECHITGGQWIDTPGRWELRTLMGGIERSLAARFVVEATGRSARSAIHADVKRITTDALVCVSVEIPASRSKGPDALVESCEAGWWYTALQPDDKRVVALFTDADSVAQADGRLKWMNLVLNTTRHVSPLASPLPQDARVRVADARTSIRNVLWRNAWMSIGDAAWSLDPLSGSGIKRAIGGGIDAAAAISLGLVQRDVEALRSQAMLQVHAFADSLDSQRMYYAVESRWRDAPFWSRRQNPHPPQVASTASSRQPAPESRCSD